MKQNYFAQPICFFGFALLTYIKQLKFYAKLSLADFMDYTSV